jgi:hypothetical protein
MTINETELFEDALKPSRDRVDMPMARLNYKSGSFFGTAQLGPYHDRVPYGGGTFFSLAP